MSIQPPRLVTYLFFTSFHHFDRDGLQLIMTFFFLAIIPSRQNNDDRLFTHGKSFLATESDILLDC